MNKIHQKKMAVINDLSGYGRCSLTVSLPIISAMKIQCCPIPTAILSNHTGFEDFFFDDYTDKMNTYISKWDKLNLNFDGIYTGFLGSKKQIDIVINFLKKFKTKDTTVVIDPVMGDNGKLYSTYTQEICNEMKELIKYADVITPNLTEACNLTNISYKDYFSIDELLNIAKLLSKMGPDKVVITGLKNENQIGNFVYEKDKLHKYIQVEKIGEDRAGTGDVFSSVVAAAITNHISFYDAVEKACKFLNKALEYTNKLDVDPQCGVCFEEFLNIL